MQDIKQREEKMQEKRKNTPWREFVKEICSWQPLVLYRHKSWIGRYPNNNRTKQIVNRKIADENRDNLINKWILFNNSLPFFDNLQSLFNSTEIANIIRISDCENADFADVVVSVKNVYLSFNVTLNSENVFYSLAIRKNSKNIYNSVMVRDESENIYLGLGIIQSFNIFYSKYIYNSSNIRFSSNMQWCHDCVFCSNLENQSYCIENKVFSKEEYLLKKEKILMQKNNFFQRYLKLTNQWNNFWSQNTNGNYILLSQDVSFWKFCYKVKNWHNIILVGWTDGDENMVDMFMWWFPSAKNFYWVIWAWWWENIYNSTMVSFSSNIYYSYSLDSCSYCLWCIWLKNKSFCILNKQYTKEERYELANKIFEKMDQDWSLWKFFPPSMNPFYFNDTVAYLIDDTFTKEEVTKEGYLWREEKIAVDIPKNLEIIYTGKKDENDEKGKKGKVLSDFQWFDTNWNRQIDPEILKKVIVDEQGNYYTIQKLELEFLQKYGLPLPEIHWLDRIKLGFRFK